MSDKERRRRLKALGYTLRKLPNGRDFLGRAANYKTAPHSTSGPTNYFQTLGQVDQYVRDVEQVRSWQE